MRIVAEEKRTVQIGDRFGRWTVIGVQFFLPKRTQRKSAVVVECDCGTISVSFVDVLRKKRGSRSCGCLQRETAGRQLKALFTTHGGCAGGMSRLYITWRNMRNRCFNTTNKRYRNYGGRGITVCDQWMDFACFREWSLSAGYSDDLTIERTDNNRNYEPANCCWIPRREQMQNMSNRHEITAFGEAKSIAEWSRDSRCVVSFKQLNGRIQNSKMTYEDAITTVPKTVSYSR